MKSCELKHLAALLIVACGIAGPLAAAAAFGPMQPDGSGKPSYLQSVETLEAIARSGDIKAQRRHIWDVISYLTQPISRDGQPQPLFQTWHGEAELFDTRDTNSNRSGIWGFSRRSSTPTKAGSEVDVPVIAYTLYNEPAYQHIRNNALNEKSELARLQSQGQPDQIVDRDHAVPAFPTSSIVLKTVWWPVAPDRMSPMPVWDPERNQPNRHGNPYTTWSRVVAVNPAQEIAQSKNLSIDFAGRSFQNVPQVGLNSFYHVALDTALAERLMLDSESRKTAIIALGRPLRRGDYLVLVSGNLMTREVSNWVWATFWWHDQPNIGPFSEGRPANLESYWRSYLMQPAFDSVLPAEPAGGAHIAFNPWLEGRFPDGGNGNGMTSNCMACHERASYPEIGFLPVTRGAPNLGSDKAFAPGRLRTSFLWSLALHAKP